MTPITGRHPPATQILVQRLRHPVDVTLPVPIAHQVRLCNGAEMGSVATLDKCAKRHLRNYIDPSGSRAFNAYDRQGDPRCFEPLDALAPGLLDARVRGAFVIELFSARDTAYTALRREMQRLLDETNDAEPSFAALDLKNEAGPWSLVRSILQLSDHTTGLAASIVTKMVHRKRPFFVPIFDSKVAAFYGTTQRTPWKLWPVLQDDLRANEAELHELARGVHTPDGRAISPLRVLDIVIWEHQVTNCAG